MPTISENELWKFDKQRLNNNIRREMSPQGLLYDMFMCSLFETQMENMVVIHYMMDPLEIKHIKASLHLAK